MSEISDEAPVPGTPAPSGRSAGLGLLIGPAAFAVAALLNLVIAPPLCAAGLADSGLFRLAVFAISLGALLVAVWGVYRAYRITTQAKRAGADSEDAPRFLGVGGIMLSVLFVALTVIVGLSGLALRTCQPV
jgi:hypothetical protein